MTNINPAVGNEIRYSAWLYPNEQDKIAPAIPIGRRINT